MEHGAAGDARKGMKMQGDINLNFEPSEVQADGQFMVAIKATSVTPSLAYGMQFALKYPLGLRLDEVSSPTYSQCLLPPHAVNAQLDDGAAIAFVYINPLDQVPATPFTAILLTFVVDTEFTGGVITLDEPIMHDGHRLETKVTFGAGNIVGDMGRCEVSASRSGFKIGDLKGKSKTTHGPEESTGKIDRQ